MGAGSCDEDRAAMVADLLREHLPGEDRLLIGSVAVAQWLNALGFRLRRSDRLLNARVIREWAEHRAIPAARATGGNCGRGRPLWCSQHALTAWLLSPAGRRKVLLGREVSRRYKDTPRKRRGSALKGLGRLPIRVEERAVEATA